MGEDGRLVEIIDLDPPVRPRIRRVTENRLLQEVYKNYRDGNLFRCCLKAFQLLREYPLRSYEIKDIFIYSLYLYGRYLAISNCDGEVVSSYNEALTIFPNNRKLMYHYGLSLFLARKFDQAKEILNTLLAMNRDHVPSKRIISEMKNQRIKSNEIAILNEKDKNEYYIETIKEYIAMGYNDVLAINAGMCNYAVIAAKNGARLVHASEVDEELIKIAKGIILDNNVTMHMLKKKSMMLDLRDDFHEKPSLLVLDIHKYGTLGEGLLSELFYFWKYMMKPSLNVRPCSEIAGEYGVVIPAALQICFAAIECIELANKYMFPVISNKIRLERKRQFTVAKLKMINFGSTKICRNIEGSYEANQLQILDFKYLTEPQVVFTVNLNDKYDVYRQLYEDMAGDTTTSIIVKKSGNVHAIAAWFNCNVQPGLTITSNPEVAKSCAWEQATFLLKEPIQVEPGTVIYLKCKKSNDKVKLLVNGWKHPVGSSLKNPVIPPKYAPIIVGNEPERFASRMKLFPCGLSNECLNMFNDVELIKILRETVHYFIINMTSETKNLRVLDASPFPFFGLLVMINAKLMHISRRNIKVCCDLRDPKTREFLEYICLKNRLNFRLFEHLPVQYFTEPCWRKDEPFDLIVTDIIKRDGDLNERVIADMTVLRGCMRNTGFLFPGNVVVLCQLMECKWVEDLSYVSNTKMDDINIRSHMDDYKRYHRSGLKLNKMDKNPLSEVFRCTTFTLSEIVLNHFTRSLRVRVINNGRVTVAGYWFDVHYAPEVGCYNTYYNNVGYQQAAFIFDEPIKVSKGDIVLVKFKYDQGHIGIKVKEYKK